MSRLVGIPKEKMTSVYVLNTIREKDKEMARKELNKGMYVHLGCSAIGHTLSAMVEGQWAKWMEEEYGGRFEIVKPEAFPFEHYHLL